MIFDCLLRRLAVAGALVVIAGAPVIAQREPQTSTQNPGPLPGPLQVPVPPQQNPAPMPGPAPAPATAPGDNKLVRQVTIGDLAEIARQLRYTDIQQRSNTSMSYRSFGHILACYIERNGDLRLVYAVRKRGIPVEQINAWNRDRRLSRAFIDKEGDPVLETDLLSTAGMTRAQILATFRTFDTSVNTFRKYIGVR